MTVRFRIRTSAGQELSFASHEMFEDFVRSGDLSLDDLVYDAENGSWAPARTHPIVLDIEYEKEEAAEAAAKAKEPSVENAFGLGLADAQPVADDEDGDEVHEKDQKDQKDEAAEGSGDGDAFGLALAPAETAEEEADSFIERMAAERESDRDFIVPDEGRMTDFSMDDATAPSGGIAEPVAPPPPTPPPPPQPRRARRKSPARDEVSRPAEAAPPERPKEKGGAGRKIAIGAFAVVVLGVGAYFATQSMQSAPDDASTDPVEIDDPVTVEPSPPPPTLEPVIASTEQAIRERAQDRFLTGTQNLFRGLRPIPEAWPSGEYLSLPSDYPEVLAVWQEYLTTIRQMHLGDEERYSLAYEAALDDAAVQGDSREARLSAAMSDLAAQAGRRAAHYDRVEALATAAIRSHAALLGAEGLILFDATGATGYQSGIGRGAFGRDADAQLLLGQVIDLLSATLSAEGFGPVDGANVRAWVWDGFVEAIAN